MQTFILYAKFKFDIKIIECCKVHFERGKVCSVVFMCKFELSSCRSVRSS